MNLIQRLLVHIAEFFGPFDDALNCMNKINIIMMIN